MLHKPLLSRVLQPGQPVQFVRVVRIVETATVRHIQAPQAHIVDSHAEGASLQRLVRALCPLQEAGLPLKAHGGVFYRQPARERDAIPLVEPVHDEFIASLFEGLRRKLLRLAFDLLHAQQVDVLANQPVDHPAHTSTDRVNIPGGNTHAAQSIEGAGQRCPVESVP